jgi:hypothetical protein
MDEIGQLKIRDVIDQRGSVRSEIKKIENTKKKLLFTKEVKKALDDYYSEMRRQRPTLSLRRKPLFPSYQKERTLRRHWKIFNTGYNEIRHAGIKNHFLVEQSNFPSLGNLYINGSERYQLSTRQYYAIVQDKHICSGAQKNDEQCIENLLSLIEQAEHIQSDSPTAKNNAEEILNKAHEYVNRIKSDELRNSHRSVIPLLKENLSQLLQN